MARIIGSYGGTVTIRESAIVDNDEAPLESRRGNDAAPTTQVKAPTATELERIVNEALTNAGYVGLARFTRSDR